MGEEEEERWESPRLGKKDTCFIYIYVVGGLLMDVSH
jgi:hypothetical protein